MADSGWEDINNDWEDVPQPKKGFGSIAEGRKAMAKQAKQQQFAKWDASPLGVIAKAGDMSTNPAMNAALGGLPEIISQKLFHKPFVDPESQMKWLSGSLGFVSGAPEIAAKGVMGLVKGVGMGANVARGALGGASAMATQLPSPSEAPTLGDASTQMAINTGAGAILGAAAPLAPKFIGSAFNDLKKSASNYITDKIAPKAYQMYQDSVNNFTPQIKKFAEEKLNVPKSALETIKQNGVQNISKLRATLGDTTDAIYQRVDGAIKNVRKVADKSYRVAMENAPDKIDIKPTIDKAGGILRRVGLINKSGKLTEFGQSEIASDSVYSKLLDFYKSADSIAGVKSIKAKGAIGDLTINQGSKLLQSRMETNVNKHQFSFLRDKLSGLYKGKGSDLPVHDIIDQLYADGEKSGITGLQNARALQRKAFEIEDKFAKNSVFGQRKLDNFHNLTGEEVRNLQTLEKETGVKFIDDTKALSAGKYLDKLNEYNPDKFVDDFKKASDPAMTNHVKAKYVDLLGQDNADKIFDEIISSRRGKTIRKGAAAIGALGSTAAAGKFGWDFVRGH